MASGSSSLHLHLEHAGGLHIPASSNISRGGGHPGGGAPSEGRRPRTREEPLRNMQESRITKHDHTLASFSAGWWHPRHPRQDRHPRQPAPSCPSCVAFTLVAQGVPVSFKKLHVSNLATNEVAAIADVHQLLARSREKGRESF